jgi:multidrug efflux pump subunit AcrA (membrane-fusion protein)
LTPLVQEGDQVHKDDTLAAIISSQVSTSLTAAQAELERLRGELALVKSPPKPEAVETAQAAVNAAQASVTQLEKDVERNRLLSEKKLISNQQLERSQSDLSIARSNLEEAKARLKLLQSPPKPEEVDILISKIASQEAQISYLTSQEAAQVITSPVNGTVTVLYRDNLLFKVADMSRVEAAIPVTDNYLQYIQPDAAVRLKVRTFSGDAFAGVVTHIASAADDMTVGDSRARFTVHAIVDNADGRLREGMSGYAKIACGRASLFTIILERIKAFIRVEFWSWW